MLEETTLAFARVEAEAPPLLDLVADLDTVHDRFSANLDEAMLPLTEFANRWDDDLLALAERMQSEVPLPQMDIASERRRIAEIRAQIPHRHSLLVDQFEIERHAIDAALTVFDDQVARLESQLNAARRTAEAIGDSMRTADFGRTVAFLRRLMEQFAVLAERGAATPEDIAEALPVASPGRRRSGDAGELPVPARRAGSVGRGRLCPRHPAHRVRRGLAQGSSSRATARRHGASRPRMHRFHLDHPVRCAVGSRG